MEDEFIREIKNRRRVRLDDQLRDYMLEAKDKGKKFILQTRKGAKIDPRIRQFADEHGVGIEIIDGLKGAFTP